VYAHITSVGLAIDGDTSPEDLVDLLASFPARATLSMLELTEADDITLDSLIQRAFQPGPVNAAARARCSSVKRIVFQVRLLRLVH